MRFSRSAWGIVAGVVAIAAGAVVQALETRFLGSPRRASFWVTFFAAGSAVLWLADRFGLMAAPYSEPTLGLGDQDGTARQTPSVTSLEAFLKAGDLDELLRVRRDISSLTSEEASRVASVINDWTDRQAVSKSAFLSGFDTGDAAVRCVGSRSTLD